MTGYQPIVSKTPTRMGAFDERDTDLIRYLGLNPAKPEDRPRSRCAGTTGSTRCSNTLS
ncbi:hypothetical protein I552_10196 [Mycobacterium xenopi 3993]|nr:hypothetical protein I552_10196 [Mycobacterium xenopi 3993]